MIPMHIHGTLTLYFCLRLLLDAMNDVSDFFSWSFFRKCYGASCPDLLRFAGVVWWVGIGRRIRDTSAEPALCEASSLRRYIFTYAY